MSQFTNYLFARPSFVEGFSRVLDLGGTLQEYNTALTPEQADALAIASDWSAVGNDILDAVGTVRQETEGAGNGGHRGTKEKQS